MAVGVWHIIRRLTPQEAMPLHSGGTRFLPLFPGGGRCKYADVTRVQSVVGWVPEILKHGYV